MGPRPERRAVSLSFGAVTSAEARREHAGERAGELAGVWGFDLICNAQRRVSTRERAGVWGGEDGGICVLPNLVDAEHLM